MDIKEQLQKLSEDEFRKKIIIPLLKILNFGYVENWCGPTEDGKDILYVREDPLASGGIVGAVLIKNKKDIRKSGGSDIRGIEQEAREAITKPISSPVDPYQEVCIKELYIATSFDIKREARDYILNTIKNSQLIIRFFQGEDLEKKIKSIIGNSDYAFSANSFKGFCQSKITKAEDTFPRAPKITGRREGKSIEPKLSQINKIIQSGQYLKNKGLVLDFLKDAELRYYFLEKLEKLSGKFDDLMEIDFILKELAKDKNPFTLFRVLENSISVKNNSYILNFISKHYEDFVKSFAGQKIDRMFQTKALRIIKKIVETDESKIDSVLEFLSKLFKKRKYNVREPFDRKDDIEQEKSLIGEILLEINKKKGVSEELLILIKDNFDLTSDFGMFSHTTPANIFTMLQQYIIGSNDFEKAFKKITGIILSQHLRLNLYKGKDGKNKFEGYEWMGGGISQSGNAFSISDQHFVSNVLRPALGEYYQRDAKKAFEFINSFCIQRDKKGKIVITKEHPAFLLRACIGILLKESKNGNKKVEDILNEFLTITKGIPSNVDLIFQEIYKGGYDLSAEQKYNLVKKQLDIEMYKNLPANIFVLKIIIDLISLNHIEATGLFFKLIKNDKLYKRMWHAETVIIEMIETMLESNPKKGLEGFKSYIETDLFKNGLGTFDAYPVSYLLNSILRNSDTYEEGLKLLKDFSEQEEPLTSNQQILVCNSLINAKANSDSEDIEILMKIYNDFLWPLLSKKLNQDLKRDYKNKNYGLIYNKFPFPYAREKFVQFAERLAKKKKIGEALDIIEIFINDPDPFIPFATDPNDPKGEYDEHKRILQGEDARVINTVRGWCGWVLLQCSVVESRPYIKKMIELAKKLIEDDNLYVASYGANALSGLARNRLTVLPENSNVLFFGKGTKDALENAKKVEKIAFDFLKRVKNLGKKAQDGMFESLLHLFDSMRALSETDAKTLIIDSLANMSVKTIAEATPLFIYFAEFRQDHFKDKDWRWKLPGLYDDLEKFSSKEFQGLLERILKRGNPEINSQFAWHLWKLIAESADDKVKIEGILTYNRAFSIAYKYLEIISDHYDHLVFNHIFRFIEENLEKKPQDCYRLFMKSLRTERQTLEEKAKTEKPNFYDWYPHYKIGDILIKIKDNIGIKKMLEIIEFLLSYPKEVNARMISEIPDIIQDLPVKYNKKNRIEKIFYKLIQIDPRYYDTKESWERKIKEK